jgi:glycosyltransferase involved in cell wall biosynthesis
LKQDRHRVLVVCTHPVQYFAPILRRMAQHPELDIQVAYCSLQGAQLGMDPEFGIDIAWDVPLLEGYPWVQVPSRFWRPGFGRFWGMFNPGLWKLIRNGLYDAVILLTGYRYASFWIALAAAKFSRKAVLFGTDASELRARDGRRWKSVVKQTFWPALFRRADVVIVPSTRGVELMRSLGLPAGRVVLTPYVVDNEWWSDRAATVERISVRRAWGVPEEAPVVLFCAKLQSWKRPLDLLRAFAASAVPGAHLVFAGEGPLREELKAEARALGLNGRVRFIGFANQTQLPEIYRASDLLVLPSEYEPFGVVVNEAMLCGCPVAVSDRVGAGDDLVSPGQTGFVFPFGNIESLAAILKEALMAPNRLRELGEAARRRMMSWGPSDNITAVVRAVGLACELKQGSGRGKL